MTTNCCYLEIESGVHAESRGQEVVHDDDADVLGVAAVAVQPEEFGQQRSGVLKEGAKIFELFDQSDSHCI